MGERVRYDGGHKRSKFLVGNLSKFVDWFPVCPEVESGMSVPREPIRLVEVGHEVRLLGLDSRRPGVLNVRDVSRPMMS